MMQKHQSNKNYVGFTGWENPPCESTKIYFDGSSICNAAAAGFIVRDSNGALVLAGSPNWNIPQCLLQKL